MDELLYELLSGIAQVLLTPCMMVLLLLTVAAVLSCGAAIGEYFLDRRYKKIDGNGLLLGLHQSGKSALVQSIDGSPLLARHKRCIHVLLQADHLPEKERGVLADKLIADEEHIRRKTIDRTNLIVRLGPMVGLLGTLIPLGPGIVALGQGDVATLSQSLATAFNTTIVGVFAAGLAYVVSMVRRHWYQRDSVLLESLIAGCLEELSHDET